MSEPSQFQKDIETATAALKGLQETMNQFVETTRVIQEVVLFEGHPEITELDDDLDTMYRGQL